MIRSLTLLSLFAATALSPFNITPQDPNAAPVAEHGQLAGLAGDWNVVSTFALPGAAPQEFQGKARCRAILGGRFVQIDESGTEFGQPSEKQKTFGFNAATRKYEGVWMYTGSTALMHLDGAMQKDGSTIAGDASFAGENGEPQKFTWELQRIDADRFSTKLVAPAPGGGPAATFTAVYTRAAKK